MRVLCLLPVALALSIAVACERSDLRSRTVVKDGFDVPSRWRLEGCQIEDGVLVLQGTPSSPGMALRIVPPLPDTGSLVVSVRVRAARADDALHVDLWGFGRDDIRQEMALQPSEMGPEFQVAGTVWPSGSSEQGIWLRVFSASTIPIEIDDVTVVYVPRDVWRKVARLP